MSPTDTDNKNRTAGGCSRRQVAEEKMLKHRCFEGFNIKPGGEFLQSRMPVLVNNDCHIVLAAPQQGMKDYFYKNTDADEMIFVHEGSGTVHTSMANCHLVMAIILYCRGERSTKLNLMMTRTVCSLLNHLPRYDFQKNI